MARVIFPTFIPVRLYLVRIPHFLKVDQDHTFSLSLLSRETKRKLKTNQPRKSLSASLSPPLLVVVSSLPESLFRSAGKSQIPAGSCLRQLLILHLRELGFRPTRLRSLFSKPEISVTVELWRLDERTIGVQLSQLEGFRHRMEGGSVLDLLLLVLFMSSFW